MYRVLRLEQTTVEASRNECAYAAKTGHRQTARSNQNKKPPGIASLARLGLNRAPTPNFPPRQNPQRISETGRNRKIAQTIRQARQGTFAAFFPQDLFTPQQTRAIVCRHFVRRSLEIGGNTQVRRSMFKIELLA